MEYLMKLELIEQMQNIVKTKTTFEPVVKSYIQNEAVSLEDRWEVFKNVPMGMLEDNMCMHYDFAGNEICWYDDHYIDRYQSVDNVNIVKRYEEKLDAEPGDYDYDVNITQENIDRLKRDILKLGVRYWKNDW